MHLPKSHTTNRCQQSSPSSSTTFYSNASNRFTQIPPIVTDIDVPTPQKDPCNLLTQVHHNPTQI